MKHIDPDIPEEKPTVCPKCGNKKLLDGWLNDDDQWDEERANQDGIDFMDDFEKTCKFVYVHDWVYCDGEIQDGDDWDDCDWSTYYGRRYYYNIKTNNYDLPRPLAPNEIKTKRIEAGLECEQCGSDLVDYHHSADERGETDMVMLCPVCDFSESEVE